jgi:hypothetical protein
MAALLELPEGERSAYLAQQPAPIRAEVESLMAAYRSAGSFRCPGLSSGFSQFAIEMVRPVRQGSERCRPACAILGQRPNFARLESGKWIARHLDLRGERTREPPAHVPPGSSSQAGVVTRWYAPGVLKVPGRRWAKPCHSGLERQRRRRTIHRHESARNNAWCGSPTWPAARSCRC